MKAILTNPIRQASEETSFRLYLRSELARRCERNPRYSLRSFARQLGVDHSSLSQILRGRRALTGAMINKIGRCLGLEADRLDAYRASAGSDENLRAPVARETQRLTQDAAVILSEWYHFAILELVRLKSFRPDSRWIARVLDISVDEVNVALQRLIRLDLLKMTARGRWVDRSGDSTATFQDFTHAAVRRLFDQVRGLELDAGWRAPAGRAERTSTTLAVNTARLPEAVERLARFHRELIAFLEKDAERDDVYQLEISLFPVTRIRRGDDPR